MVAMLLPDMVDQHLLLDQQLCFPLYAAARAMMRAYQPLLGELDLTYPQYLVMLVLWERDGASVKALGEKLYLDSGTLTPLLKRLEHAGLVRRTRTAEDERVVEVWLTPQGKKLKRKAEPIPEKLACSLGFDSPEIARVRRELLDLYRRLRDAVPRDPAP
jgi:DNA-binding MarR family transcriptional regulator